MENQAKIRINLNTKEMEIEGSEEFINSHSSEIRKFLESQSSSGSAGSSRRGPGRPPKAETKTETEEESTTTTETKQRGPGRPRKKAAASTEETTQAQPKKSRRGRPSKKKAAEEDTTGSKKENLEQEVAKITDEEIQKVKNELPERFGDFFLKLPKDTKDVDKVVAGGFFVQNQGENNTFSTRETTRLLKTVGVKLSNPSQCVKYNVKTGRIKNIRRNRYRLTDEGERYIVYLLKNAG